MLNGFGVIVLIIETIRFIKTHKKEQNKDSIKDVIKKEDTEKTAPQKVSKIKKELY
ncbi:hypothetical protein [Spiroplasma endosymbiont of Megaselia nigra]|uniref:hypothetical protein n=1 Tax=Spiroplasma endosymbiont of Megaselia nigra TaxID=2478537 RepID=UPI00131506F3|nr:hypothetical protein [Spiroplasma endosymbiont of Megaselia nigra]